MAKDFDTSSDGAQMSMDTRHGNLRVVEQATQGVLDLPIIIHDQLVGDLTGHIRRVPISSINAIAQSREDYGDINALAEGIKSSGILMQTPFVGQFTPEAAKGYLDFVNGIYGDKIDKRVEFSDLVPTEDNDGNLVYLIVIAGHRRLRALKLIEQEFVDINVAKDIDPTEALFLQAQENTQKALTDIERAENHGRLWRIATVREPDLTKRQFASKVAAGYSTIVRDLRYYDLPEEVKAYVVPDKKNGTWSIPFNVACQLGRLVEKDAPIHEIISIARSFYIGGVANEGTARRRVTTYLNEFKLGEQTMGDIFGYRRDSLMRHTKHIEVARRYARPIDDAVGYLRRVTDMRKRGLGNPMEDGLSFAGAATRLGTLSEVVEDLLPGLAEVLEPEMAQKIAETFAELRRMSHLVQSAIPDSLSTETKEKIEQAAPSLIQARTYDSVRSLSHGAFDAI